MPGEFFDTAQFRIRTGTEQVTAQVGEFLADRTITPSAPLRPLTRYTVTITPQNPSSGPPYSFDFTTGNGPDTTGPEVVSIDPAPGSAGIGVFGPFTVKFNKVLSGVAFSAEAPAFRVQGNDGTTLTGEAQLTADRTGFVIRPLQGLPGRALKLTVNPAQVRDAAGNRGRGSLITAQYTTFGVLDTQGPLLRSHFPASGEGDVPTNVAVALLFERPLSTNTAAEGIVLESDGVRFPFAVATVAGGNGILLKPSSLLPAQRTCRVSINSKLRDAQGIPAARSVSFEFTTGATADVTSAAASYYSHSSGSSFAPNSRIVLHANKRIMPLAMARTTLSANNRTLVVPAAAALSEDGRTIQFTPSAPLLPSTFYELDASLVVDYTGASFLSQSLAQFQTGAVPDNEPPRITGTYPVDGQQGVPTNARMAVLLSERAGPAENGPSLRLLRDGEPVPGTLATGQSGLDIRLSPGSALAPDTAYVLEIAALADSAGNASPPRAISFTTASTASTAPPRLESTTPANGSLGHEPGSPVVFRFVEPVPAGITTASASMRSGPASASLPVRVEIDGPEVRVYPADRWPAAEYVTVAVSVGAVNSSGTFPFTLTFGTGVSEDRTPPEVVSVSPEPGSTLSGPVREIALTFSEPVNPATVTAQTLVVYRGTELFQARAFAFSEDNRTIRISLDGSTGTEVVVLATSRIRDLAGNGLVPFRAEFRALRYEGTFRAQVVEQRPPAATAAVPPGVPITFIYPTPADLEEVRRSTTILADGVPHPGEFESTAGGRVVVFRPAAPFPAGSAISKYERGQFFEVSPSYFVRPSAPDAGFLRLVRAAGAGSGPLNRVLEFEFNKEPPPGLRVFRMARFAANGSAIAVDASESRPRPRTVRLTPSQPLAAGSRYVVTLSEAMLAAGGASFSSITVEPQAAAERPLPSLVSAGPSAFSTGVPVNARIGLLFSERINPLTLTDDAIQVQAAGRAIPVLRELTGAERSVSVLPLETLPEDSLVSVFVSGLEDYLGRAIPGRQWSFQTGRDVDLTGPRQVATSAGKPNTSGIVAQVAAESPVLLYFDEPVDPARTALHHDRIAEQEVQVRFSEDLRTVAVAPLKPWAKGLQGSISMSVVDLARNSSDSGGGISFVPAFDKDTTAPRLLASSPIDGQTGLPLNVEVSLVFDEAVAVLPGAIRLFEGNTEVPLTEAGFPAYPEETRLRPRLPLKQETEYRLVAGVVRDTSGNPSSPVELFFRTGAHVDTTAPAGRLLTAVAGPDRPVRYRLSEPVSRSCLSLSGGPRIEIPRTNSLPQRIPSAVSLSEDGRVVSIVPDVSLTAGARYVFNANCLRDFSGNGANVGAFGIEFTALANDDTTPPAAIVSPPDGATGVPVNAAITVTFNEAVDVTLGAEPRIRLYEGGEEIRVTVGGSGVSPRLELPIALRPGATYRVEVSQIADLAGNEMAPVSSTFTVGPSANPDFVRPRLSSSRPTQSEQGVAVDSSIVFTFSERIHAGSVGAASFRVSTEHGFGVRGSYATSGNTVTFTADGGLPPATTITASAQTFSSAAITDLAGNPADGTAIVSFRTGVVPDSTPPALLEAAPPAGTALRAPSGFITLRFSEPVIVRANSLRVFSGATALDAPARYTEDATVLALVFTVQPDAPVTVVGSGDITDLSGNRIEPFQLQYTALPALAFGRPRVERSAPLGITVSSPTERIIITFDREMDQATLPGSIRVTEEGDNITGDVSVLENGRVAAFTPHRPYRPGSRIRYFVLTSALDLFGQAPSERYIGYFDVAGAKPQNLTAERLSFSPEAASAPLEVEFDGELDASTVHEDNVWLRSGGTAIPGRVSPAGERAIRFDPLEPLEAGRAYVLTAGPRLRGIDGRSPVAREFPFVAASPAPPGALESVDISDNGGERAIRLRFTAPVNPLSARSVRLLDASGRAVEARLSRSADGLEWLLTPVDPTAPLDSLRVEMDGVRDNGGRVLPRATRSLDGRQ